MKHTLEVFPADCPEHTLFSSHAAYPFELLFGPCMLIFGSGVPANSQLFLKSIATLGTPMYVTTHVHLKSNMRHIVKVPNRAVAMDAWARLACYPQGNFYRIISGRI
jgi:hypothetical protein